MRAPLLSARPANGPLAHDGKRRSWFSYSAVDTFPSSVLSASWVFVSNRSRFSVSFSHAVVVVASLQLHVESPHTGQHDLHYHVAAGEDICVYTKDGVPVRVSSVAQVSNCTSNPPLLVSRKQIRCSCDSGGSIFSERFCDYTSGPHRTAAGDGR